MELVIAGIDTYAWAHALAAAIGRPQDKATLQSALATLTGDTAAPEVLPREHVNATLRDALLSEGPSGRLIEVHGDAVQRWLDRRIPDATPISFHELFALAWELDREPVMTFEHVTFDHNLAARIADGLYALAERSGVPVEPRDT